MSQPLKRLLPANEPTPSNRGAPWICLAVVGLSLLLLADAGCRGTQAQKSNSDFFTSGSREADQRASQRMAQSEQLSGSGEGSGEKGLKKAEVKKSASGQGNAGSTNQPARVEGKLSLYDRLGGQVGISNIVADFTARVLVDPRVNWERQGLKRGGLWIHRGQSLAWEPTPQNKARLQAHMAQFLALATGGPPRYDGKPIQSGHAEMKISNPEFDAAVGDLKASLDKLQVPNTEQKELLAIVESTRPQIVTER